MKAVNTLRQKGKTKRWRNRLGRRSDIKKAIVTLHDVQVVHGSNHEGEGVIDPACNEIKQRLPVQFDSLQMVTHRQLKLNFGEYGRVDLPTGRNFTLMPISIVRDRLHVHFQIKDLVDTRLQLRSGRPVILGGQAWDDGKLIIMLKPAFKSPASPAPAGGPRLHRVGQ